MPNRPDKFTDIGIGRELFEQLAKEYAGRFGVRLLAVDNEGAVVFGEEPELERPPELFKAARKLSVGQAYNWGEPIILDHPEGWLHWAIPFTYNSALLGGMVAGVKEADAFFFETGEIRIDLKLACTDLRLMAERENLVNSDLLAARRRENNLTIRRALISEDLKSGCEQDVISIYRHNEGELIAAIRRDERPRAVELINHILAQIYFRSDGNLEVTKSFIMELIITMCRSAAEIGAAQQELYGTQYYSLAELGTIDSEEDLSRWLTANLNLIMDQIAESEKGSSPGQIQAGINFIREHLAEPISRDDAARAACMSPSSFSRRLKESTGCSFTDFVLRLRVNLSTELLRQTDQSLLQIALDSGFSDQSYFTKIFRRQTGLTPREYRASHSRK